MRFTVPAVLTGEALALTGLWFAWWPLALVAAGVQLVTLGLVVEA